VREPVADDWSELEAEHSEHPSGKRAKEVIPFSRIAFEVSREVARYAKKFSVAGQMDLLTGEKRSEPVKQGRIDWDESQVNRNEDGEFARKGEPAGKPSESKHQKPPSLSKDEFTKQYNEAFDRLMDYPPNEVGSQVYAEKLAKLENEYPEFAKQMDEEAELAKPEKKPGVPSMQTSLFDTEPSGQKKLFDYVAPKKADNKKKPESQASLLESIDDDLKAQQAANRPLSGQRDMFSRAIAAEVARYSGQRRHSYDPDQKRDESGQWSKTGSNLGRVTPDGKHLVVSEPTVLEHGDAINVIPAGDKLEGSFLHLHHEKDDDGREWHSVNVYRGRRKYIHGPDYEEFEAADEARKHMHRLAEEETRHHTTVHFLDDDGTIPEMTEVPTQFGKKLDYEYPQDYEGDGVNGDEDRLGDVFELPDASTR